MDLPIEQYLRGTVGFDIPDLAINAILVKRQIEANTMVSTMTEKDIDLSTADLYMYCASTPSVKGVTIDAHGSWKHQEGGWESSAFDKRNLRKMANDLYAKWGEKTGENSAFRIIRL